MKTPLLSILWIAFMMVSCSGQATPTIYIPAEQVSTPASDSPTSSAPNAEPTEKAASPQPSPSPVCKNNLMFLADINIPDGTQVGPEEILDKRWLVENNGTCNWDRRFNLRLIAGPDMGASPDMALFPARSGSQAEIQIQFTGPQEPGIYRSAWQAVDPQGNLFGDPIFIEINVISP